MKSFTEMRSLLIVIVLVWVFIALMLLERREPVGIRQVTSQAEEQASTRQSQDLMVAMTEREKEALDKFVTHEARFKEHYRSHFATSQYEYHQYRPAYQHGFELALDTPGHKMDWNSAEPQARRTWDESTMGIWNQYKDAVRYGWEQGVALEGK